ncbi:uncharacterized protein LOC133030527 [Cannabis sativa]|uniref:uncharacterized protein LOC133030527 n=1 Tax=Cannabis sativa TaxID=3483 RepID=UPI0029CA7BA7|nr:uncharacterized protein LOC133030527 [Cannabis sativa]
MAYISHFNIEVTKTHGVDDSARLMALGAGIAHGSIFWNSLQGKSTHTIDEFMKRAEKYMNTEEARIANNLPLQSLQLTQAALVPPELTNATKASNSLKNNKRESIDGEDQSPKKSRSDGPKRPIYLIYTEFIEAQVTIYVESEHRVPFRVPKPMKHDRAKRDASRYCQYHKDIDHTTNECQNLKDEIETLVLNGTLTHYAQHNFQGGDVN